MNTASLTQEAIDAAAKVINRMTTGEPWDEADSIASPHFRRVAECALKSVLNKTFTEAELLAEYWAAHLGEEMNALMTGNPRLRFSQRHTLRRFATTPSYTESDRG